MKIQERPGTMHMPKRYKMDLPSNTTDAIVKTPNHMLELDLENESFMKMRDTASRLGKPKDLSLNRSS